MDSPVPELLIALVSVAIGAALTKRVSDTHRCVDAYAEWLATADQLFSHRCELFSAEADCYWIGTWTSQKVDVIKSLRDRVDTTEQHYRRQMWRLQFVEESAELRQKLVALDRLLHIFLSEDEMHAYEAECMSFVNRKDEFIRVRDELAQIIRANHSASFP